MSTIGIRDGHDDQDEDESRPLPDMHAEVQATVARRDLDAQRIRWELAQMGLTISTPVDTVSVDTTMDVDGQVVTVTDAQHLSPGQDPATIRAAVRSRATNEAVQEALEQAQVEQRREDDPPQHRARQL